MDKLTSQQRHDKAAIKQEQSDACISSAEREQARRSANMAAIRSKDTKPEMIVRRGLWSRGFRYRLNHKRLPGHPDLVLRKYRTCIFVNEFWVAKIRRNKERDREAQRKLAAMGWHCITVWECELTEQRVQNDAGIGSAESRGKKTEGQLKPKTKREETLDAIAFTLNHIWLQDHGAKTIPYPEMEEEDSQMAIAAESREGDN